MLIDLCAWRFNLENIGTLPLSFQLKDGLATLQSSEEYADFNLQMVNPEELVFKNCSLNDGLSIIDDAYWLLIDWRTSRFMLTLNADGRSPDQVFIQAINAILCLCAIRQGGLAVHAASVVFNNKAIILCGRSGAGKSTTANALSPPCAIIDDDFSLIVQRDGRLWVGSSPLGKTGCVVLQKNRLVPLQKVYYVCKASRLAIEPLATRDSMRFIAPHIYAFPDEHAVSDQILSSMAQVCRDVAHARLFFDCATAADYYIPQLFGGES
jgi:hypothetical protein